jgi:hypothetical protein
MVVAEYLQECEVKKCGVIIGRNTVRFSFGSRYTGLALQREERGARPPHECSRHLTWGHKSRLMCQSCQSSTAREILDRVVPRDQEFRKIPRQFDSTFADRSITAAESMPRTYVGRRARSDCVQRSAPRLSRRWLCAYCTLMEAKRQKDGRRSCRRQGRTKTLALR